MKRGQRDAYGSPQLGRPHSPDSTDDRECRAIAVSSQRPPIAARSPIKGVIPDKRKILIGHCPGALERYGPML